MTGDWRHDIVSFEQYQALVATGMAWEFYPELPCTWKECKKVLEEDEYGPEVRREIHLNRLDEAE